MDWNWRETQNHRQNNIYGLSKQKRMIVQVLYINGNWNNTAKDEIPEAHSGTTMKPTNQ